MYVGVQFGAPICGRTKEGGVEGYSGGLVECGERMGAVVVGSIASIRKASAWRANERTEDWREYLKMCSPIYARLPSILNPKRAYAKGAVGSQLFRQI